MRICLILEGSYPYTHGGVSSWMHGVLNAMPDQEFIIWAIGAKESDKGKFKYELPANVVEVHEVFLDAALRLTPSTKNAKKLKFSEKEKYALQKLIDCQSPDWDIIFDIFSRRKVNPVDFLSSEVFLDIMTSLCETQYPYLAFAQTFHTMRSMMLPVLHVIGSDIPEADMYHAISTGYAGLLGAMASSMTGRPLMLTEHGIYSREREEELIRAQWVIPAFKKQWIRFFYMLSDACYSNCSLITSLFGRASKTQQELGADPSICRVVPNGIKYNNFCDIPIREDDGFVNIGAVIRLAEIKDVKTLIYAFYELSNKLDNVRLYICGGVDNPEYAQECYDLAERLKLDRLFFVGQINVLEYMQKFDFTVLTSMSEGQPLSILESLAARRPCVSTDVGCCRELLFGEEGDDFGQAGYVVEPMHRESLAHAFYLMCKDRDRRVQMGINGQLRVQKYFKHTQMIDRYQSLYRDIEQMIQQNKNKKDEDRI